MILQRKEEMMESIGFIYHVNPVFQLSVAA